MLVRSCISIRSSSQAYILMYINIFVHVYIYIYTVEEDGMSGACSTNGGRGMRIGCWWESQRDGGHWEDQDVGGWIILGWIF
jgi:hypothetical protein